MFETFEGQRELSWEMDGFRGRLVIIRKFHANTRQPVAEDRSPSPDAWRAPRALARATAHSQSSIVCIGIILKAKGHQFVVLRPTLAPR